MHCRDAFEDFFTIIHHYPTLRGVIHCFSGSRQDIRIATEQNLHIGLDGNLTFSPYLQSLVPHIPLSHLLLETDAPYLTPIPNRGKRNEPKYIPLIGTCIATLLKSTSDAIATQTTMNARALFRIPTL